MTQPPARQLRRDLSSRQIAMISLGGAIGTGLFLGSGLALSAAGPIAVAGYAVVAVVAVIIAYAVAEMVSVRPEPGGFAAVTHRYLGPLAGFVLRWLYWAVQVIVVGSEVVAAGIYVAYWWPGVPLWLPVAVFAALIVGVNVAAVKLFGEVEYWFAMIKVSAIAIFVLLGALYIVVGLPGHAPAGWSLWTQPDGIAPYGLHGLWLALAVITVSYGGVEAVAVTAAESSTPARDLPRAARRSVARLVLFYVLAMAVVVSVVPWRASAAGGGLQQSPFVVLFQVVGVPAAAALMNFVVLTAALSAANTNLYVAARMMHALGNDGYAPRRLGQLDRRGTPVAAVLAGAAGLAVAAWISAASPGTVFPFLLGLALFGGLSTWALILASHYALRRREPGTAPIRVPGAPATTGAAFVFVIAVLVTTAFFPPFATAWKVGLPAIVALVAAYALVARRSNRTLPPVPSQPRDAAVERSHQESDSRGA